MNAGRGRACRLRVYAYDWTEGPIKSILHTAHLFNRFGLSKQRRSCLVDGCAHETFDGVPARLPVTAEVPRALHTHSHAQHPLGSSPRLSVANSSRTTLESPSPPTSILRLGCIHSSRPIPARPIPTLILD